MITALNDNQKLIKDKIITFPDNGEPYITGARCLKCGKLHFPATTLCTSCYSEELETAPLDYAGTIYCSTTVYIGVKGFKTPYMLAWVDLNDSRLAAQLDWDPARKDEIKPGMKVRMVCSVLRQDADGKEIVGYKFRPLFDEEAEA
jgi:uncharacterized OB-fold protein